MGVSPIGLHLISEFGRQLYRAFAVRESVNPKVSTSVSTSVEGDTVTFRFSLDSQTVNISAIAVVPFALLEDYLSGLLKREPVTTAHGRMNRYIDPLDELEFVFNNLEGVEESNKRRSTREALSVIVERFGLRGTPKKTLNEVDVDLPER